MERQVGEDDVEVSFSCVQKGGYLYSPNIIKRNALYSPNNPNKIPPTTRHGTLCPFHHPSTRRRFPPIEQMRPSTSIRQVSDVVQSVFGKHFSFFVVVLVVMKRIHSQNKPLYNAVHILLPPLQLLISSSVPSSITIFFTSLFHCSNISNLVLQVFLRLFLFILVTAAVSRSLFALPLSPPPPGLPMTPISPHGPLSTSRRYARDQPEISRLGETSTSNSVNMTLSSRKSFSGCAASHQIIIGVPPVVLRSAGRSMAAVLVRAGDFDLRRSGRRCK